MLKNEEKIVNSCLLCHSRSVHFSCGDSVLARETDVSAIPSTKVVSVVIGEGVRFGRKERKATHLDVRGNPEKVRLSLDVDLCWILQR